MNPQIIHEDTYGSVIDYPDDDYLEVRWYDSSDAFTGETFSRRSALFADLVEQHGRSTVLIDAVQFGMNAEDMDVEWRDANVIPRLNDAGLRKIALVVPADVPPVGAPPAPDGPANFPTAFFATRAEARAWLAA
ncbi:MAG: STAS/SEC14 domain-containing protein [Actinomycetota bacterium]